MTEIRQMLDHFDCSDYVEVFCGYGPINRLIKISRQELRRVRINLVDINVEADEIRKACAPQPIKPRAAAATNIQNLRILIGSSL